MTMQQRPGDIEKITTPNGGWVHYDWQDVEIVPVPSDPTQNFTRHLLQYRRSYDRNDALLGEWRLDWGNNENEVNFSWKAHQKRHGACSGRARSHLRSVSEQASRLRWRWCRCCVSRGLLYRVRVFDPLVFLLAPLSLIVATAAASYVPARRVLRIEPSEALRPE